MAQTVLMHGKTTAVAPDTQAVAAFIAKWGPGGKSYRLGERQGAQPHFMELCQILAVDGPDDPESYCFERGFQGVVSSRGFADVWKRGCFAWEYKAPHGDLGEALKQLIQYALPLENPPLLVVSDRLQIRIHTHFTGHPSQVTTIHLEDLRDPQILDKLRAIFTDPDRFKPSRTTRDITEDAASAFASIADRLRLRGLNPRRVAHFLTQCVFCLFAEDTGLLRDHVFKRLLRKKISPAALKGKLSSLFAVMQQGGSFGTDDIDWFNGGLFNEIDVPDLADEDVHALHDAAQLSWKAIDATIFGTLFERGLDPNKRAQLGAFYTDPTTIYRLVEPTVKRPLLAEWQRVRARISELMESRSQLTGRAKEDAIESAQSEFDGFLERLHGFKVLDPACGSGNFLYLALKCIKDVEHLANIEAEQRGLLRRAPTTGPHNVLGLEINPYASELARLTVWIGELQWLMEHGYTLSKNPVLRPLDQIENRDALLDGSEESRWPASSVIVGNPPFLGDKKMRAELGDEYTSALRRVYAGRVPGGADLVCYWFEKSRVSMDQGVGAVGLVATNSVRGGKNRAVLDAILKQHRIFEAWGDEPWVNEGAAVRVSLIAFGHAPGAAHLDGVEVSRINADLTGLSESSSSVDMTGAQRLVSNQGACFIGGMKKGAFDIPGELARQWLRQPNPNGRPNSDVLRPWMNGLDVTRRPMDMWIVDFPQSFTRSQAALYELPFAHVLANVKPARDAVRNVQERTRWWIHARTAPDLRSAIRGLSQMIVSPRNGRHRLFVKVDARVVPDGQLVVVAREDDVTLGILQSRLHELWSLRVCTWLGIGNDPRYTPTTCFETFPFPVGLAPSDTQHLKTELCADGSRVPSNLPPATRRAAVAIASAAKRLHDARELWLNPHEWVTWERMEKFPPRVAPRAGFEDCLSERTLTNLYNENPPWLSDLHDELDTAVARAYGWKDYRADMTDDEVLSRLLVLNTLPGERRLL